MNDLTAADIDAVVLIPFALCHEMRAHGQSLARGGNTLLFVPCGEGFQCLGSRHAPFFVARRCRILGAVRRTPALRVCMP